MKLKVLKPFKDKLNLKKTYKAGDTLVTEDLVRINDLVARGFCAIASLDVNPGSEQSVVTFKEQEFPLSDVKSALEAINIPIAANAKEKGVEKVLAMLTEEQAANLSAVLSKEEPKKEPETGDAEPSGTEPEEKPKEE